MDKKQKKIEHVELKSNGEEMFWQAILRRLMVVIGSWDVRQMSRNYGLLWHIKKRDEGEFKC